MAKNTNKKRMFALIGAVAFAVILTKYNPAKAEVVEIVKPTPEISLEQIDEAKEIIDEIRKESDGVAINAILDNVEAAIAEAESAISSETKEEVVEESKPEYKGEDVPADIPVTAPAEKPEATPAPTAKPTEKPAPTAKPEIKPEETPDHTTSPVEDPDYVAGPMDDDEIIVVPVPQPTEKPEPEATPAPAPETPEAPEKAPESDVPVGESGVVPVEPTPEATPEPTPEAPVTIVSEETTSEIVEMNGQRFEKITTTTRYSNGDVASSVLFVPLPSEPAPTPVANGTFFVTVTDEAISGVVIPATETAE